ncbi:unnamed protein product, partial [Heterotrigona itama]
FLVPCHGNSVARTVDSVRGPFLLAEEPRILAEDVAERGVDASLVCQTVRPSSIHVHLRILHNTVLCPRVLGNILLSSKGGIPRIVPAAEFMFAGTRLDGRLLQKIEDITARGSTLNPHN